MKGLRPLESSLLIYKFSAKKAEISALLFLYNNQAELRFCILPKMGRLGIFTPTKMGRLGFLRICY